MGCTQSKANPERSRTQPCRYEEFERELLADTFRGPSETAVRHINEYEPDQFEPTDRSKPPLLLLAIDNDEWFRCLIGKCDPTVTWIGEDGRKKNLGDVLMGTSKHALWTTKVDEWKCKNAGPILPSPQPGPRPTWDHSEFLREFGNVALALGITTVAVGGAACGVPAAALGPVIWMVIRKWHNSFSKGIRSSGSGAQELQELQRHFDRSAELLGTVITMLGGQIEEIDANHIDAKAAERRDLQTRVDTLKCLLEDDTEEMARVGRSRSSQLEKKRIMTSKLRSLVDLCTSQEVLCNTRQILRKMSSSHDHHGGDAVSRGQSLAQSSDDALDTPEQFSTAPVTGSSRAAGAYFSVDATL
eukprot:g12991.t1